MAAAFPPALPDAPRLPSGSTEGGKMAVGFTPSCGAALHLRGGYPHTQPQVGACRDPSPFPAYRAQSLRALTQQRKSPGKKYEEEQEQGGSHRRGFARRAPPL